MKKILATLMLVTLTACASVTSPRGVNDALAYAQGQVTATAKSCAQAAAVGDINKAQAVTCATGVDKAAAALDVANSSQDVLAKQDNLSKALSALTVVQTMLREQKAK